MDNYDWLFEDVKDNIVLHGSSEALKDCSVLCESSEDPVWITAKGDRIHLSKMETRHIKNCIRLLESKNGRKNKWYKIFQDELKLREISKFESSYSL